MRGSRSGRRDWPWWASCASGAVQYGRRRGFAPARVLPCKVDSAIVAPKEASLMLTIRMILLLVAVVLFVLAAVGIDLGKIALVPLGFAFFAGAFVVPDTALSGRR